MWLGQSYHVPDHLSNSINQSDSTLAQIRQTVQVFSPTTLPYSPQESVWGRHIAPHAPFSQPSNPVLLIALYNNAIWDVGRDVSIVCQDRTVP